MKAIELHLRFQRCQRRHHRHRCLHLLPLLSLRCCHQMIETAIATATAAMNQWHSVQANVNRHQVPVATAANAAAFHWTPFKVTDRICHFIARSQLTFAAIRFALRHLPTETLTQPRIADWVQQVNQIHWLMIWPMLLVHQSTSAPIFCTVKLVIVRKPQEFQSRFFCRHQAAETQIRIPKLTRRREQHSAYEACGRNCALL